MEDSKDTDKQPLINITNYRKLVKDFMNLQDHNTSLFWADKVCALSNGDPMDVYNMAQCMYSLNEYHRASEVIKQYNLHKTNMMCHYLAVKSLVQAKMFAEALDLLNSADNEPNFNGTSFADAESIIEDKSKMRIYALLNYLRGQVFEALDNRVLACEYYRMAIQNDVHCYEAFNALVQHQMLTALEEKQLLDSLPFNQQCTESESVIVRSLYEGLLKKFHSNTSKATTTSEILTQDVDMQSTISELKVIINKNDASKLTKSNWNTSVHVSLLQNQSVTNNPTKMSSMTWSLSNKLGSNNKIKINETIGDGAQPVDTNRNGIVVPLDEGRKRLDQSFDVQVSQAEMHFYNCRYKQCLKLTEAILKKDPFHVGCLKVHISCLSEMCNYNKLFYLAHKLVDLYPDKAISWYAVGCYYYIIGKSDPARRYLAKATSLDKLLGPAWLAYGHSFGVENEHDQAMAAYFKASQLMRGCHLPMLYIGLECGLTNNNKLAEKFFQQAEKIAPEDPFVIHEMGVIAFHNQDYQTAENKFREALAKVSSGDCLVNECWETLINNLGHACRRNGKLQEALDFHKQALRIDPQNPNTYAAIGFVQALMKHTAQAVDSFHIALGLRRDDTFSTTMLSLTIEQLMEEDLSPDDFPNDPLKLKGIELREGTSAPIKLITPEKPSQSVSGPSQSANISVMNETNVDEMSMSMEE